MPSSSEPPAAADIIDLDHLREVTLSDPELAREVLGMFESQAGRLMEKLAAIPEDAGPLAHTLKGSARAIGAHRVAAAAAALEAAIAAADDMRDPLARLGREVTLARQAIAQGVDRRS